MAGWRLEALLRLLFYAAAAVLAVVLPLHLLEHVPWGSIRRSPDPLVLYTLLIAAGVHGSLGLRSIVYDYTGSTVARRAADLAAAAVAAVTIGVGLVGLVRSFPLG